MSAGEIVIVAYRPKPGREAELLALMREHLPLLRAEGLATAREPIACRAADGTVVEMFEWAPGGAESAHTNPRVLAMWGRYAEVSDYVPLKLLPEAADLFASFSPIEL